MPDLNLAAGKQEYDPQPRQGDDDIRKDHDPPAAVAVHKRPGKGREDHTRQDAKEGSDRQHCGGAGFPGQVPHQGKLGDVAAQDGSRLPAPDGEEPPLPIRICV